MAPLRAGLAKHSKQQTPAAVQLAGTSLLNPQHLLSASKHCFVLEG